MVPGFPEYTRFEICTRFVYKDVMDNFQLRFKKCTELNGGHLGHMLQSSQEQADRHVLALCLEYNKLVLSERSFHLNDNLRNDTHRKLGPVFGSPCIKIVPYFRYVKEQYN